VVDGSLRRNLSFQQVNDGLKKGLLVPVGAAQPSAAQTSVAQGPQFGSPKSDDYIIFTSSADVYRVHPYAGGVDVSPTPAPTGEKAAQDWALDQLEQQGYGTLWGCDSDDWENDSYEWWVQPGDATGTPRGGNDEFDDMIDEVAGGGEPTEGDRMLDFFKSKRPQSFRFKVQVDWMERGATATEFADFERDMNNYTQFDGVVVDVKTQSGDGYQGNTIEVSGSYLPDWDIDAEADPGETAKKDIERAVKSRLWNNSANPSGGDFKFRWTWFSR
ncbi:unnamed protein product, partial [marine sediment metagenome]